MVSASWSRAKLADAWRNRAIGIKAISFALIGSVNTVVDYSAFLLVRTTLKQTMGKPAFFAALSDRDTLLLITANTASWLVAVTGSYIMNSSITFAVDSGRKLHWRAYAAFVVSGTAGLIANTMMLVFSAQTLLLPMRSQYWRVSSSIFCYRTSLFSGFATTRDPQYRRIDAAAASVPAPARRGI